MIKNNFFKRYRFRGMKHLLGMRVLALILIFLALLMLGYNNLIKPPAATPDKGDIFIEIPPNKTTAEIGKLLQEEGVIKSARAFRLYTRVKGLDGDLKAGEYYFAPGLYLDEVLEKMVSGEHILCSFTIPEGYTIAQIADYLVEKGFATADDFYREASSGVFDYKFTEGLPGGGNRLEGYLFPDTYTVRRDTDVVEIINIMLQRFDEKLAEMDYMARLESKGLSLHEAVTIASMVEREARVESERPLIAGVIFNRLNKGMPLQIDATVLYALGDHKPVVYYSDLEIDSPYNTYLYGGLPPGPIASPGEACLEAVVEPTKTDYLYYCAKPDGSHAFAYTLAEHEANVRKYIKE